MSKRIPEFTLATQINPEDQFIFYSNSVGETQRISKNSLFNNTGLTKVITTSDQIPPQTPTGLTLTTARKQEANGGEKIYVIAKINPNSESDLASYGWSIRRVSGTPVFDGGLLTGYGGVAQIFEASFSTSPAVTAAGVIKGTDGKFTREWEAESLIQYEVTVCAIDKTGNASPYTQLNNSAFIQTEKDTVAPAAPTSFTGASAIKTVFLNWTNPADSDFSHVKIYRNTSGTNPTIGSTTEYSTIRGSSFVDSAVTQGTTFYYWLTAVDRSGNESPSLSNRVSQTPGTVAATDISTFAVDATKMFTNTVILTGDSWSDNYPSSGYISWNAHTLVYGGASYSISAGSTNLTYVFWTGGTAYQANNTNPTLADNHFMIATNTSGGHDLAWNGLANAVIGSAFIQNAAITNAKISELNADKIRSGAIQTATIELLGEAIIKTSGVQSVDVGSGLWIKGESGGNAEFGIGDLAGTNYGFLKWKSATNTLSVKGAITATSGTFGDSLGTTVTEGVKIDAFGLTLFGVGTKKGRINSGGLDWNGSIFTPNQSGFYLGHASANYKFFIGNSGADGLGSGANNLYWTGTELIINGRIGTGSTLGEPNSGSSVNDQGGLIIGSKIGIRRNVNNDVLSITGGKDNWGSDNITDNGSGQIDLVGKNFPTVNNVSIAGVVQLIGGKSPSGNIFLRTWLGTGNLFNECLTASRNGSVGINDTAPSNSNGIKLDVYGSMRIREGVVYSTYTGYSGYTVALNDGVNDIRFQNNNVGLYAKVNNLDDVLIVSPKLNLSSRQVLAPFSFATSQGTTGALVISDTNLTWDSNGTLSNGSGIVINPNGIVGALNGVAKFTITKSGDATFAGALSAPTGNFGGWTIGNTNISGGNITIDSSANNGYIATGQTNFNTGTGFWVGSVSGTAKLSVGNSAGNFLTWDGSSLSIKGSITLVNTIPSGSVSGLGTLATQNSISYGSLTGTKPPENADVTLNAINGSLTLTGGGLVLASGGASIRGGQTAFNTGTGFFLGDVGGTTKFSVGNSVGNFFTWDGSTLTVNGNINVTGGNASTQTHAQGVASAAGAAAQSAAASDATAKANAAQSAAASDATAKANAAQSAAASDATAKANTAQASATQTAALDATLKANVAFTNAKAVADAVANGTYSGGTLISGKSIFSPEIAGVNGYFSNIFKVGQTDGITLDGLNKRIYIGAGTYNNANTGFYVDKDGNFSLQNKLVWNSASSTLTVQGSIVASSIDSNSTVGGRNAGTIAGAINSSGIITQAALNEKLNATAGTIIGEFALTGSGALQIGTYSNNQSGDVRITPNGITARNTSGATTFSLVASTGDAVFKGDITGASGTFSGTLSATVGTIGGLTIAASRLHSGTKTSLNDTINGFYLGTDGVSLKGGTGAAALEIVGGRGRFTTRNAANEITGSFQGEDGSTGGSFMFLANSTGVDTIGFYGQSGFGYFTTFYDKNNTNYYCDPASTSVFAGLDVDGVLLAESQIEIQNGAPFLSLRDTDNNSGFIHVNTGLLYLLSGGTNASTWTQINGQWPFILDLHTNNINVGGDFTVYGALSKGSGSFRIEHPLPSKAATHELVHSFIEGPRCALIYSGKINLLNGIATINIDADSTMTEGTFEALCKNVHCFTTNETGWGAIRGKVVGNILTIEAQDLTSIDSVSWMVIGERKDKHIMDTDWTDENGRPIIEPLKKVIKDPIL